MSGTFNRIAAVCFLVILAAAYARQAAMAAPIAVTNADFEDVTGMTPSTGTFSGTDGAYDVTSAIPGWTEYKGTTVQTTANGMGVINPAFSGSTMGTGPDQTAPADPTGKMALLWSNRATGGTTASAGGFAYVIQTTGHTITALDDSITLTFDEGKDTVAAPGGRLYALFAENGSGVKSIIKQVGISGTGFATTTVFGASSTTAGTITDPDALPTTAGWASRSLTVSAVSLAPFVGQKIGIALSAQTNTGNKGWYYDNVALSVTALPEPASLGLCAGAASLLAGRRRRS